MNIWQMWRSNATSLTLLILCNLAVFSLGETPWIVLGCLFLLLAGYIGVRQGMAAGHESCSLLESVERCSDPASPAYGQLDKKVIDRAWSRKKGVVGVLLSAMIPFAASLLYLLSTALKLEALVMPTRVASWVLNMPFWPIIAHWQKAFDTLTPAIAVVLVIAPFVLPLCLFFGYMQGPKLWKRSEIAMAQGRRRAKARSRVGKKTVPKPQKPEI